MYRLALVCCLLLGSLLPAATKADRDRAIALGHKGDALWKQGKLREALPHYREAVDFATAKLGPSHLVTLELMDVLGVKYRQTGDHKLARTTLLHCLSLKEGRFGPRHIGVALTLFQLGIVDYLLARYDSSETYLRRSLGIRKALLGNDAAEVGHTLVELGCVLRDRGNLGQAEVELIRALDIYRTKLKSSDERQASALANLGGVYDRLHQYERCLEKFRQALAIREKLKDDVLLANSLTDVARTLSKLGRHQEALPLYQRCLKARTARLGSDHQDVALTLHDLGFVYYRQEKYEKAVPLLQRALRIKEKRLGADHPALVPTLNVLADIHNTKKEPREALALYRRALTIGEKRMGQDHPEVVRVLSRLGRLSAELDGPTPAGKLIDRARRSINRYALRVLPTLAERDQGAFLSEQYDRLFHQALSLSVGRGFDSPVVEQSAEWLVNGKGVAHEALASSTVLARDRRDPRTSKLAGDLGQVRRELAQLTLSTPRAGEEKEHLRRLDELNGREQDLARGLRLYGGGTGAAWVGLAELRKALPRGAVYVDLARMDVWDFKKQQWLGSRYRAWVVPDEGRARSIDLGPAAAIDSQVLKARQLIEKAPKEIPKKGEDGAEKDLQAQLRALARMVLDPIVQRTKGVRLVVSPDAALWLVPWEALVLADGKYAIEKYQISYVVSGRDLVRKRPAKSTPGRSVVLADPDYELGGGKSDMRRAGRLPPVPRLEHTADEARAVADRLARWTGRKPEVYLRDRATEATVKAVQRPGVLHLATHAFFLGDRARSGRGSWENPLTHSGIMLAGCNRGTAGKDGDDGVLTALEVCGLDLRGCELVVLSACETGLGRVRAGQGVAGLRQAFLLAGASNVVSSLWSVSDTQTAQLMVAFFDGLARGEDKAVALRRAQLRMIAERRESRNAAHPLFWAAFTLTQ
jgi:CHAT domain-containing protein/Tfp pilus assembly protein PilF